MAQDVNKAILIGRAGRDAEIRTLQDGRHILSFSLATSNTWKDKSGQKKENTDWHRIIILNESLISAIGSYIKKGSKIYVEGRIETKKWVSKTGEDRQSTDIILRPYQGIIILLDGLKHKNDEISEQVTEDNRGNVMESNVPFDDDIPF